MINIRSLKRVYALALMVAPLLVTASCHTCDDAVFTQGSSVTFVLDKPIAVARELDITIVGCDAVDVYGQTKCYPSQTYWYVDRPTVATGSYAAIPTYNHVDGGVGYIIKSLSLSGTPSSLTYHLVADGVTVADGSATPTYQHLVESHENCSLTYDQASVVITVQ